MASEDPLQPHSHDPNPRPPSSNPSFLLLLPDLRAVSISPAALRELPRTTVGDCYIVSTGHGTTGPFRFSGVTLLDLIQAEVERQARWSSIEVTSADGFGTRVHRQEVLEPSPAGPILLADTVDGGPMSRQQGLVRLIIPSETDDALRQVKWLDRVALVS